ncbi:1828_t:CDS:2, partial [Funneliformis caledonium]
TWESRNAKKVREAEEKSKAVDDQSLEKDLKKEDVDDKEYPCLFRAECGKIKISTLVSPSDTDKFFTGYTTTA